MELEGLAVLVVVGIGAVPICAARAVAVAVRLVAGHLVAVACQVAAQVPGVPLMVPHHRRWLRRQRA